MYPHDNMSYSAPKRHMSPRLDGLNISLDKLSYRVILGTMLIGKQLKTIRREKNLTQRQLAGLCKVDQSTVSYWEKDQRAPRLKDVNKIAKALNVTVSRLLSQTNVVEIGHDFAIIAGDKIDISGFDRKDIRDVIRHIELIKARKG